LREKGGVAILHLEKTEKKGGRELEAFSAATWNPSLIIRKKRGEPRNWRRMSGEENTRKKKNLKKEKERADLVRNEKKFCR